MKSSALRIVESHVPPPDKRCRVYADRIVDAHKSVSRSAHRLLEEMDEVTSPHGLRLVELSEEDSIVKAVAELAHPDASAKH